MTENTPSEALVEAMARALAEADNIQICESAQYRHSSYGIRARAAAAVIADALAERDAEIAEPWKSFHGDLPDYDHPLRCVYESGIQYAVNLLAKELGVDDWEACDGTEEFDGDLGGTMMNIVCATLPEDQNGDRMWPSQVAATIAERDAEIARLREGLEHIGIYGCGMLNQPAAMNGPEEAWLKQRILEMERTARAALGSAKV